MFNLKEILISPSVISIAAGWEIYCLYICSPHSANGCLYYSTVLMGCKENHPDVMTVYHRMATQTSHYLNCASVCVSVCACIVCAITVKVGGMEWFFKSTVQFMLPTVYLITFYFVEEKTFLSAYCCLYLNLMSCLTPLIYKHHII